MEMQKLNILVKKKICILRLIDFKYAGLYRCCDMLKFAICEYLLLC